LRKQSPSESEAERNRSNASFDSPLDFFQPSGEGKWGNTIYAMNEKDISWLLFYEDHVDLGSELDYKPLEDAGKSMRHIKIMRH